MKRKNGAATAAECDDKAKTAAEMEKCSKCDGEGEVDGKTCDKCDGEGEVEKKPEAEGDDGKPHDEPDGDEASARAELAGMVGLSGTSSLRIIAATAKAKLVPLSDVAAVRAENATLAGRLAKLERKEHTTQAESFVTAAISAGRTTQDKREHLVGEFVKAERAQEGSGPGALEPMLYPKGTFTLGRVLTVGGKPVGKAEQTSDFSQESVAQIEKEYSEKASAIAARDKISFSKALAKMPTEHAELHAKLRAARAAGNRSR